MKTPDAYPFDAYTLTPKMLVKKVTLVEPYSLWGTHRDYHRSSGTRTYHSNQLYASERDAIAAGRERLKELEEDLVKRATSIQHRKANLDKAEAKLSHHP